MSKNPAPSTGSKYERLADDLRVQMAEGALQEGDRLPTFREMRENFGATPTTVERVYRVLEEEGLIVRGQGKGVFVAQTPTRVATGIIGLSGATFARRLSHPYFAHLLEGVYDAAARAGREILVLHSASEIKWERLDGVLLCKTPSDRQLPTLPPGMPCVAILAPVDDIISVIADDARGVREVTNHLLRQGHRAIGFLHDVASTRRLSGYYEALRVANIEPRAQWVRAVQELDGLSYADCGHQTMRQWLAEDWRQSGCTALLTQNDDTARGTIEALAEAGLKVPEDVSVVGYDGTELAFFSPALTTIEVPLREIGARGVEVLLGQMEADIAQGPSMAETIMMPVRLKVGQTTAPPAHSRL